MFFSVFMPNHERNMIFPEKFLASSKIILIEDYGSAPGHGLKLAHTLISDMKMSTPLVLANESNNFTKNFIETLDLDEFINHIVKNPSKLVFIHSLTPLLIINSLPKVLKFIRKFL